MKACVPVSADVMLTNVQLPRVTRFYRQQDQPLGLESPHKPTWADGLVAERRL